MTLRWGFLGASAIGKRAVAPAVLAVAGNALSAIGARDLARAKEFAAEFGIAKSYGGYKDVIEDPDIDVIYNALPNDAHLPWTIAALNAGKHVLCEKPLALTAAEVRQMQDAEGRSGRRVMEAFCHIFHPHMLRIRDQLSAGAIGKLVGMECGYGMRRDYGEDFRWIARHGGGSLYDVGCYCVSALRMLSGREPVRAAAVQAVHGEVDESFSGLLDFGDGIGGRVFCSYVSARTQRLTLIGSDGAIAIDWPFGVKGRTVRIVSGDQLEEFVANDPYTAMVEHFVRAVRGDVEMMIDLAWSLRQASTLDALFAAARTGMTVGVGG